MHAALGHLRDDAEELHADAERLVLSASTVCRRRTRRGRRAAAGDLAPALEGTLRRWGERGGSGRVSVGVGGGARREGRGRGAEGRRATGGRRSAAATGSTTRRGRRRGTRGDERGGVASRGPGGNWRGRERGGSRTASSSSNIRVRFLRAGGSDFARSPPPPPRGKDASSASSSALSRFDPIADERRREDVRRSLAVSLSSSRASP